MKIYPFMIYILKLFQDMKPRWRNWWVRIFFTLVMIATFAAVIYSGPFAFMGLVRIFFILIIYSTVLAAKW